MLIDIMIYFFTVEGRDNSLTYCELTLNMCVAVWPGGGAKTFSKLF